MSLSVRGLVDRYRLMGSADTPETGRLDIVDGVSPPDFSQPWRDFLCNVVKRLSLINSANNV